MNQQKKAQRLLGEAADALAICLFAIGSFWLGWRASQDESIARTVWYSAVGLGLIIIAELRRMAVAYKQQQRPHEEAGADSHEVKLVLMNRCGGCGRTSGERPGEIWYVNGDVWTCPKCILQQWEEAGTGHAG